MYKRGISLTALVVTVIIMILLAGISMTALFGDNGVVKQAMKSKENTDYATAKEMIELAWSAQMIRLFEEPNMSLDTLKSELNAHLAGTGSITYMGVFESDPNTYNIEYKDNKGNRFYLTVTKAGEATVVAMLEEQEEELTDENIEEIIKKYKPIIKKDRVSLYGQGVYTGVNSVKNGDNEVVALTNNVEDLETVVPEVKGTPSTYNWKVFYIDNNDVYLIYRDYYPNKALLNLNDGITHGSGINDAQYDVRVEQGEASTEDSDPNREKLLAYLGTPSNWSNIVSAFTDEGKPFAGYASRITAYGTPTADMWVDSYNEKSNSNYGYAYFRKNDIVENYVKYIRNGNTTEINKVVTVPGIMFTLDRNASPVYYSEVLPDTTTNPDGIGIDQASAFSEGGGTAGEAGNMINVLSDPDNPASDIIIKYAPYRDNMYFPRKGSIWFYSTGIIQAPYTYGYWLRSPVAYTNDNISVVYCNGCIGVYPYHSGIMSVRPIVQIPRDVFENVMNIEIEN